MSNRNVLNRIASNWERDAKAEAAFDYFYLYDEVNNILSGDKNFVIGRKGSGKTSICQHIINISRFDVFVQKLSFKQFPFNVVYPLTNSEYRAPNQYISIWKYLIYCYICRSMSRNENISVDVRSKISRAFPAQKIENLAKDVKQWTATSFGAQVLGCGFSVGGDIIGQSNLSWIDLVSILEEFILENIDGSDYYIVFDELDEDYHTAEDPLYLPLLTSLFKAVYDIKNTFGPLGKKIHPIIFLRDDIYRLIKDADKNKWKDNEIELSWNLDKIKNLIGHRLSKDFEDEDKGFDWFWNRLLKSEKIKYGNSKKLIDTIQYISYSTLMRPRDFVQYIKMCSAEAKNRKLDKITNEVIKYADREFSNYFYQEFIDEVPAIIPEISIIFNMISKLHKMNIAQELFRKELQNLIDSGEITSGTVDQILERLYEFSIIGNMNTRRESRPYFKYTHTNMTFNNREAIVIHRGLYKALHLS